MPTERGVSRGFAHPYLLIIVLVVIGIGITVFVGSKNLIGLVLGAKTKSESSYQYRTNGLKVTIISPSASWDLAEYLCETREQCQKSPSSGKWWATISGAPTTEDGHEVFIEKADGWSGYTFVKVTVKKAGMGNVYISPSSGGQYYLYDLTTRDITNLSPQVVFQ